MMKGYKIEGEVRETYYDDVTTYPISVIGETKEDALQKAREMKAGTDYSLRGGFGLPYKAVSVRWKTDPFKVKLKEVTSTKLVEVK